VFGINGRLERKLRNRGMAARATVLSVRDMHFGANVSTGGNFSEVGPQLWTFRVRVEPDGEPVFDAKIVAWHEHRPQEREIVPVLYDPSNHRKIILDRSVEAQAAAKEWWVNRDAEIQQQAKEQAKRNADIRQQAARTAEPECTDKGEQITNQHRGHGTARRPAGPPT
jgi:hypothetical protein